MKSDLENETKVFGGKQMVLTREQTITEHRKMWKWISRQIMKDYKEQYLIKAIASYKKIYLENNFKNEYIRQNCFCCNYAYDKSLWNLCSICSFCPLYWNAENTEKSCTKGYYGSLHRTFNNITVYSKGKYFVCEEGAKKLSRMAYKIAMLEERKETNED